MTVSLAWYTSQYGRVNPGPGLGLTFPSDVDTALTVSMWGGTADNTDATEQVEFTLMPAISGRVMAISRVAPYPIRIVPDGTDTILGTAGAYTMVSSVVIIFTCVTDGEWQFSLNSDDAVSDIYLCGGAIGDGSDDTAAVTRMFDNGNTAHVPAQLRAGDFGLASGISAIAPVRGTGFSQTYGSRFVNAGMTSGAMLTLPIGHADWQWFANQAVMEKIGFYGYDGGVVQPVTFVYAPVDGGRYLQRYAFRDLSGLWGEYGLDFEGFSNRLDNLFFSGINKACIRIARGNATLITGGRYSPRETAASIADEGGWSMIFKGSPQPKSSTASGATTTNAGFAIGTKTIALANAGTGTLVAGDQVTFAGQSTVYNIMTGDADVSNGGSIVIEPGLVAAIPAATTAITVEATTGTEAGDGIWIVGTSIESPESGNVANGLKITEGNRAIWLSSYIEGFSGDENEGSGRVVAVGTRNRADNAAAGNAMADAVCDFRVCGAHLTTTEADYGVLAESGTVELGNVYGADMSLNVLSGRILIGEYARNITRLPISTISAFGRLSGHVEDRSLRAGLPSYNYLSTERHGLYGAEFTNVGNVTHALVSADAVTSTAAGATTDGAAYALGIRTVTLAAAGAGSLVAGDYFTLAGDTTAYRVTAGIANTAAGGAISFMPGLMVAIGAAPVALTVSTLTGGQLCKAGENVLEITAAAGAAQASYLQIRPRAEIQARFNAIINNAQQPVSAAARRNAIVAAVGWLLIPGDGAHAIWQFLPNIQIRYRANAVTQSGATNHLATATDTKTAAIGEWTDWGCLVDIPPSLSAPFDQFEIRIYPYATSGSYSAPTVDHRVYLDLKSLCFSPQVSDVQALKEGKWRIPPVCESLFGSATYNPGALWADGAGETTTVTVAGAQLGDFVTGVSYSVDIAGVTMTGWVSAANTVSVRFQNETGGNVDLSAATVGAATLRATVRSALL